MEFRYHPIIEGLKVNENGTEVYYNGNLLAQFVTDKSRQTPTYKVNFQNKAHSVSRLVCEAWNGLRQHSGQRVSKINDLSDNHYSNLEWKEGSANGVGNFAQKIKADDLDNIIELLKSNKSQVEIAKMYNVHKCTIGRIHNKYVKNN